MRGRGILMIVCVLALTGLGSAAEVLTHVDVFTSGTEGYHTFRIPAIETAPDGTLIALAEARKYNSADPGFHGNDIDLVSKRSTDGGKTWSKLQVVDDPGELWSACNPATTMTSAATETSARGPKPTFGGTCCAGSVLGALSSTGGWSIRPRARACLSPTRAATI